MNLLVAGTRTFRDKLTIFKTLEELHKKTPIDMIYHGGCQGPDQFSDEWAKISQISTRVFIPEWKIHGKAAGPIRNEAMVKTLASKTDKHALVFWDGISKGTKNLIDMLNKNNITYTIKTIPYEVNKEDN